MESTVIPRVYIIGEDHERMQSLLQRLDARGVPTEVWNTAHGALVPTCAPPPGILLCRQSPSAWSRGHGSGTAYAKELLRWLEHHGATVINGSQALDVETSKALQMMHLHSAGLNTPLTVLQQGVAQVALETPAFHTPVIVKPNHGGSGKHCLAATPRTPRP